MFNGMQLLRMHVRALFSQPFAAGPLFPLSTPVLPCAGQAVHAAEHAHPGLCACCLLTGIRSLSNPTRLAGQAVRAAEHAYHGAPPQRRGARPGAQPGRRVAEQQLNGRTRGGGRWRALRLVAAVLPKVGPHMCTCVDTTRACMLAVPRQPRHHPSHTTTCASTGVRHQPGGQGAAAHPRLHGQHPGAGHGAAL